MAEGGLPHRHDHGRAPHREPPQGPRGVHPTGRLGARRGVRPAEDQRRLLARGTVALRRHGPRADRCGARPPDDRGLEGVPEAHHRGRRGEGSHPPRRVRPLPGRPLGGRHPPPAGQEGAAVRPPAPGPSRRRPRPHAAPAELHAVAAREDDGRRHPPEPGPPHERGRGGQRQHRRRRRALRRRPARARALRPRPVHRPSPPRRRGSPGATARACCCPRSGRPAGCSRRWRPVG